MATEFAAPFPDSPIETALQFRKRGRLTNPNCVDGPPDGTSLQVSSVGGTSVNIADGRALVEASLYELTSGPLNIAVPANGGGSDRTDYAVLTYDSTHDPGVYARVLAGTALTENELGIWDFPLATWKKTPAGAIVAFTDLRIFRGSIVFSCTSTARPRGARPGQIAHERDTGRWIGWPGSGNWKVLGPIDTTIPDTGRLPVTINTDDWQTSGLGGTNHVRRVGSLVTWQINVALKGSSSAIPESAIDTNGLLVATFPTGPAGFSVRPTNLVTVGAVLTGNKYAELQLGSDGKLVLRHVNESVAGGTQLRASGAYDVEFLTLG